MSTFSWIRAFYHRSRLLSSRQAVVWMGGIVALSSAGYTAPHYPPRSVALLQADATNSRDTTAESVAVESDNSKTKPIYPDLRPTAPRWSWDSIFGMLPTSDWRTRYGRLQRDLENEDYHAMPDPATVMIPSHAITGALLKEHYIEAYRIYCSNKASGQERETTAQRTTEAARATEPQIVALVRVGTQVDGHEGIVHGGIIAILIDDVLGYGFYSIGWPAAFTANLSINYRKPVPAASILRIECYFEGQERRKLHWKVRVVDAKRPSILYAEASSLFVVPKKIFEQVLQQDEEKMEQAIKQF